MGLLPTSTILTNEIKLYDFKGTKASLTFGDTDINDGYSYLRMNFRANDFKFDFWQDKPVINFIADEEIMFNDKKIWHENNDGPMSGLNADMLDGLHGSEYKDRNGHHHFNHAFIPGGEKMFVKIATFTPRRVGNAPDFDAQGNAPYQGTFAENIVKRMEANARFEAFVEDTPDILATTGIGAFEHTDMASEGIYNSTLRASISILRKGYTKEPPWNGPETIDVHVGLFEDPTNLDNDGWTCTSKYFYVSSHERNLPFIKENDNPNHDYLVGNNVMPLLLDSDENIQVIENIQSRMQVTQPDYSHEYKDHVRPAITGQGYVIPPDPTKNNYKAQKFPAVIEPGFGYQKDLEAFRLYHVDSHVDKIDGLNIVTHKFELYMAIDTKSEIHVQPYMSSSCLFYNYQKPISESELPQTNYLKPKSIYDTRYSHVEHRHRNYEQKIENMDEEIEQIWKSFDYYVPIEQGVGNANKVVMTNSNGSIVCEIDNFERHQDGSRYKCRVMVSDNNGCIVESTISTTSLAQLEGIRSNIQQQIDEHTHPKYEEDIRNIIDSLGNYVLKNQGGSNANKVLMTDGSGIVYCAVDNIEKHKDTSRYKLRVVITDSTGCIVESSITTTELDQLDNIRSNIQKQIDDLNTALSRLNIPNGSDYVKKSGDTMTGNLNMNNGSAVVVSGPNNLNQTTMYLATGYGYSGLYDSYEQTAICGLDNTKTTNDDRLFFVQKRSFRVGGSGGTKVTINSAAPSNPSFGDIWIKNN